MVPSSLPLAPTLQRSRRLPAAGMADEIGPTGEWSHLRCHWRRLCRKDGTEYNGSVRDGPYKENDSTNTFIHDSIVYLCTLKQREDYS